MSATAEIQNYKKSLQTAGYDAQDFDFQTCTFRMADKVRFTTEKTIVIRKSNGISRVYNASGTTSYLFEFAQDLKSGVFGI